MNNACDIIIPAYNHADVTIRCLRSIISHTDSRHPVCVVDDCSAENEFNKLRTFAEEHRIRILRRSRNGGFIESVNQGIAETVSPYICIMNNDTEATAGWLDALLKHLRSNPDIGIVNPASNQFGMSLADSRAAAAGSRLPMHTASGFCMVFARRLVNELGAFDPVFGRGFFEESDFCRRVQAGLGLKSEIVLNAFVHHEEGHTFGRKSKEKVELMARNREIFEKRWGAGKRYMVSVAKEQEAGFSAGFGQCRQIAAGYNRIKILTNSRTLSQEINDPFRDTLQSHWAIRSSYIRLPSGLLCLFGRLKFFTAGKRYSRFMAFPRDFS